MASQIISVWLPRGRSINYKQLLGPEFFAGDEKQFTKEEWVKEKAAVTKMARKMSKILRDSREGKTEKKTVSPEELIARHKRY